MAIERQQFSLSDQVKSYLKIYAPRPELRRLDTAVGNLALKVIHGKGRFPQDRITENNYVSDINLFISSDEIRVNEAGTASLTKDVNMQLPSNFRSEIQVLLYDADEKLVGQCNNLADLGLVDLVSTISLAQQASEVPYYFFEFAANSSVEYQHTWIGNTMHIKSPVEFSRVSLMYWGYGKRYQIDSYNNAVSISWIDLGYPEYVALEIAKLELMQAGYQQEASNLETMRREAEHAFLTDQAAQEGGAYNG